MGKKLFTLLAVTLFAAVGVSSVMGAGTQESGAQQGPATLDPVALTFALPGSELPDTQAVLDRIVEESKAELNLSGLRFEFIPQGDYAQTVAVRLAAGDNIDVLFNARWMNYYQLLNQGALLDISKLFETYGENLHDLYTEEHLNAASSAGALYGLPWSFATSARSAFFLRQDIADRYGLKPSDIQTLADVERVLKRVKADYPDVIPFHHNAPYERTVIAWATSEGYLPLDMALDVYYRWDDPQMQLYPLEDLPRYEGFLRTMQGWIADELTVANPLAGSAHFRDLIPTGRIASYMHTFGSYAGVQAKAMQDFGGVAMFNLNPDMTASLSPPINNMYVFNQQSRNPERAMMFLNWVFADQSHYDLLLYGFEGTHYVLEDGKVYNPEGVTAQTNRYQGWRGQWPLWHDGWRRFLGESEDANWVEVRERSLATNLSVEPHTGFVFDSSAVRTEVANRAALISERGLPLKVGMLPADEIAVYREQAERAGIDTLLSEMQKQLDEWRASQ